MLDRVHTRLHAGESVVQRGVGRGEVDDHLGIGQQLLELAAKLGIGPPDETQIAMRCDGRRGVR